jgi:hypothetical protein
MIFAWNCSFEPGVIVRTTTGGCSMRLISAIIAMALATAGPGFAQTLPPPDPAAATTAPEPAGQNAAKSEEALSGKPTPQKGEDKKEDTVGTQTGWSGQWKTPQDDKSEAHRNEAQGQSVKQPDQGK